LPGAGKTAPKRQIAESGLTDGGGKLLCVRGKSILEELIAPTRAEYRKPGKFSSLKAEYL